MPGMASPSHTKSAGYHASVPGLSRTCAQSAGTIVSSIRCTPVRSKTASASSAGAALSPSSGGSGTSPEWQPKSRSMAQHMPGGPRAENPGGCSPGGAYSAPLQASGTPTVGVAASSE
jgi:hypothetical protein